MGKNWWSWAAALAAAVLAVSLLPPAAAEAAPPRGSVKVRTQRMTDATLKSTQVGWYGPGRRLDLSCYKRGQWVTGYYGGPSNLWYLTGDGYYVADVDMNTGSNNPITGACPATARIDSRRSYTVTSRNSGKLVDVRNASTSNGAPLQQNAANSSRAQSFRFIPTGGGFYRAVSDLRGSRVWDAARAGRSDATRIVTWSWGGPSQAHQQWMPVAARGGYVTFRPGLAAKGFTWHPGPAKPSRNGDIPVWQGNVTGHVGLVQRPGLRSERRAQQSSLRQRHGHVRRGVRTFLAYRLPRILAPRIGRSGDCTDRGGPSQAGPTAWPPEPRSSR